MDVGSIPVGIILQPSAPSGVVYQNGGFTPAWSVSQWWLAGRGTVTRGLRGCSLAAAYASPVARGRSQPPHSARH